MWKKRLGISLLIILVAVELFACGNQEDEDPAEMIYRDNLENLECLEEKEEMFKEI